MPKEAIARGGVARILPLDQIAREVLMAQSKF
jgi:two-component system chemotaxis response regulator CheB